MAILSHAFGATRLSGKDAKKFKDQVTYGKPKPMASSNARQGVAMVREFNSKGEVRMTLRREKRA